MDKSVGPRQLIFGQNLAVFLERFNAWENKPLHDFSLAFFGGIFGNLDCRSATLFEPTGVLLAEFLPEPVRAQIGAPAPIKTHYPLPPKKN